MENRQIEAAWNYHNGTKHSYDSIRRNAHYLDWDNQPVPFKIYSDIPAIPLPADLSSSGVPALLAISTDPTAADRDTKLTKQTVAELLFLSAGITRRRKYPGGEILFRAAACTGALYHIDLYVACAELEDLPAGVYHFSPHDFALRRLREGNYIPGLTRAGGQEPSLVNASCVIISASTYWRNAWKYQARAYRHCYWDNGTILANLLAAAAARNVPAQVVLGFVDRWVNQLLSLDTQREAALSLVALGHVPANGSATAPALQPLRLEVAPLSKHEIDYPTMSAMHEASSLDNEDEARAWRKEKTTGSENPTGKTGAERKLFPLQPMNDEELPQDTLEDVVIRRGSTRQFSRSSISLRQLSTMLDRATRGIPADFISAPRAGLNDLYLIVHAVDGLPAGAYVYRRERQALELLEQGDFRRQAGHLGLGQEIPADCSVNVYFLADLERILERFGNRGYRAAQLEAAIIGGKLYLAAYAQHLGASGLTFFDDAVTDFFSPDAAGKSVMFLIALGRSARQKS
jgi:SagB-type dehydrogenase family enzyme